jgi:hypothetical protein
LSCQIPNAERAAPLAAGVAQVREVGGDLVAGALRVDLVVDDLGVAGSADRHPGCDEGAGVRVVGEAALLGDDRGERPRFDVDVTDDPARPLRREPAALVMPRIRELDSGADGGPPRRSSNFQFTAALPASL